MRGPQTIEHVVCNNCELLKTEMLKSGSRPIRIYWCKHDESKEDRFYGKGHIGTDEESYNIKTPNWCPIK